LKLEAQEQFEHIALIGFIQTASKTVKMQKQQDNQGYKMNNTKS